MERRQMSSLDDDLTALHYERDMFESCYICKWIPADGNYVRQPASLDRAYSVGPTKQIRRVHGGSLNRLHGCKAKLDHYRKLASVHAVRIDRCVGAEGHFNPRFESPGDVLARGGHHHFCFCDHELRHAHPLIVLNKPITQIERGNQISTFLFHQANCFLIDE